MTDSTIGTPIVALQAMARIPIGMGGGTSPAHRGLGCCTWSHGHHVTIMQPCAWQATSSHWWAWALRVPPKYLIRLLVIVYTTPLHDLSTLHPIELQTPYLLQSPSFDPQLMLTSDQATLHSTSATCSKVHLQMYSGLQAPDSTQNTLTSLVVGQCSA